MFEELSRENIERYVVSEIGRPTRRDARVRLVEFSGRRAILKDVHDRGALFRLLIGRRLIAREFRFYRLLEGIEGFPRAYRMLDSDGVLLEYVESRRLSRRKARAGLLSIPQGFYDRCMAAVGAMHERGVFHLDLRNRKNFLLGEGDRPYIIDFASAVRVPRWLPFRRILVWVLGRIDRGGVLKMKRLLSPELLSAEERRFLTQFDRARAVLWPPSLIGLAVRRVLRKHNKAKKTRHRSP